MRSRCATVEAADERGDMAMVSDLSLLHSRLDLEPSPLAVRRGRAHAEAVLTNWGLPDDVVADSVLVVSELLTNAVRHARRPDAQRSDKDIAGGAAQGCNLLLWCAERSLTVAVHDADSRPPVLRDTQRESEGGRGLVLVDTLAAKWGCTYPSSASGKVVWARFAVPARAATPAGDPAVVTAPVRRVAIDLGLFSADTAAPSSFPSVPAGARVGHDSQENRKCSG
jgi:hypothetical protein